MKKLLVALCITCAIAFSVEAKGKKGHGSAMTDEQKAVLKEITEKYDANKDGKLDKEEKSKISAEDKAKLKAAGLGGDKKGKK